MVLVIFSSKSLEIIFKERKPGNTTKTVDFEKFSDISK